MLKNTIQLASSIFLNNRRNSMVVTWQAVGYSAACGLIAYIGTQVMNPRYDIEIFFIHPSLFD
jgi:hypothetical protein